MAPGVAGEQKRLASRTQFLQTHLMVLEGAPPFSAKYLDLLVDAVESQRSMNDETEELRARILAKVAKLRGRAT